MARRNNNIGRYAGLYGGDARGLYTSGSRRNVMIYGKAPRRWPKVLAVIVVVLIIAACIWLFACDGLSAFGGKAEDAGEESTATVDTGSTLSTTSDDTETTTDTLSSEEYENGLYQEGLDTTITLSAIGDCTLGYDDLFSVDDRFDTIYDANGSDYFFDKVLGVTSADDLTVANLEGPLTNYDVAAEGKSYNFHGSPEYTSILTDGSVEAVNLANNHSYDYGEEGYETTKKNLKKAGLKSFGYDRISIKTVNGIRVGFFGIDQVNQSDPEGVMLDDIDALKEKGCALIIGVFHWGTELSYEVSDDQVSLAHAAIDAGCDVVLGTHPHVLQGVEVYNDRYICYSLGNFCFGGNDDPTDYDTMIFQETFTFEDGWLVADDDTLTDVQVVPCRVSSTTLVNNYQPTPLDGDEATSVLEKVNESSEALSGESVVFRTNVNSAGYALLGGGALKSDDADDEEDDDEDE